MVALRLRLGIETERDRERGERFDRALSDLSEADRAIFLMARRDDLSFAEIARRRGIPVSEAQARLARALEQIARGLAD